MQTKSQKQLDIVLGLITNSDGQVLIAKRPSDSYLGGYWEFPGGKVESGEEHFEALKRELLEEVNIDLAQAEFLLTHQHEYPDKIVSLNTWLVATYQNFPHANEGQELRWCRFSELGTMNMLPANAQLLDKLRSLPGMSRSFGSTR